MKSILMGTALMLTAMAMEAGQITGSGSISCSGCGTIVLTSNSGSLTLLGGDGNVLTLEVDDSAPFGEVVSLVEELSTMDPAELQEVELSLPQLRLSPADQTLCKKLRPNPRSYEDGVSTKEAEDIGYIVKSLANESLTKLKSEESSLKRAGDRIDHVHPLHFLLTIFTNEELKVCLRNLEGRSWVWKDFLKGLTESLEQEYGRDNLMPYLDEFAQKLNIDSKVLMPTIKNGRWDKFVTLLISIIPRAAGSNRYDM